MTVKGPFMRLSSKTSSEPKQTGNKQPGPGRQVTAKPNTPQTFKQPLQRTLGNNRLQRLVQQRSMHKTASGEEGTQHAPPIVHSVLQGQGIPLDDDVRSDMESRFKHDFSRVRIHNNTQAAASARSIRAQAYTVGDNIVFGQNQYALQSMRGRHLLTHELAHVVQQGGNQGNIAAKLTIGSSAGLAEHEADTAANRACRGESVNIRRSSTGRVARRVLRREHGTYVSTHGDPTYLNAGYRFYRTWGYPNVRRVSTMHDILRNLRRARGTIDKFRIVSHGSSLGLQLGLLPEISNDYFGATQSEFTTKQRFRKHISGFTLVNRTFTTQIINALRADAVSGPLLTLIGVGNGAPASDSALGIYLQAIIDAAYLAMVQLDTGGRPVIANRNVLIDYNRRRSRTYGRMISNSAARRQRRAIRRAIRGLPRHIGRVMNNSGLVFNSISQADADTMADPFTERNRLKPELRKSITEGAGGPFLRLLRRVRRNIDKDTEIEIRGCNVGRSSSMLDKIRGFFGNPTISAPDLFQYFFRLNYQSYELRNPVDVANLQRDFNDPTTGYAESLQERQRIQGREMVRVTRDRKLSSLCTRYGLNLAQVTKMNPEITKPDQLVDGQAIWLVQREEIQAGRYKKLEILCRDYLGNQYAWPAVWAKNPHLKFRKPAKAGAPPQLLKPNDRIKFPRNLLKQHIVSPKPGFADMQRRLNTTGSLAGVNPTLNRPFLALRNQNLARNLADWLAAQRFDPRGRTAAQLSRLYAGRRFRRSATNTYIQFLSRTYPNIEDPIFPEDPRYNGHIIRRP